MNTPSLVRPSAVAAAVCLLALAAPGAARADDVAAAARAYSKAQAAELADDHERAALLYELADRTANAAEALRGAARSRLAAGDHAVAASHALELGRRYPDDPASRKLAARILSRVAGSLTLVDVRCARPCTVSIDGAAVGVDPRERHRFYLAPGISELIARFAAGERRSEMLELVAGKTVRVSLTPPPAAPTPEAPAATPPPAPQAHDDLAAPRAAVPEPLPAASPSGLSKAWFYGGVGLTLALAGAATWSGLDVLDAHHHYEEAPTEDGYQDGLRRQRRTNLLIGGAAAAAAVTLTVAFFTRWSSAERRPPARSIVVAPIDRGAVVAVDGSF